MQAIPAHEIRERFLRFYEERGHVRMASDSLVPANDPTLLFTGAGMNQFKDMFLGRGSLPHKRVTTSQKCLRVPDLENVGVTPRHHTFFEMLGHFSFGDYFKSECIAWEWEFFTKELGFPAEQLVVTIYEDDDEAFRIWTEEVGLAPEKIFRFGEKENFWPAEAPSKGPNGPCGPCSELYFDSTPEQPYPDREGLRDLPDDRFTEVGNCVFTQFDRQSDGSLAPLPQTNIDVGLGLERIAAVLADASNNFETDLFRPYLDAIAKRSNRRYGEDPQADVRMRRIADHARAVTFCIADGALPSNEGRGYVVRKILRRAARDGYELGITDAFLHELVDVVGATMGAAYPEVREHAAQCRSLIRSEEEGFATVYTQGMRRLREFLGTARGEAASDVTPPSGAPQPLAGSGEFAFQLHDTYGFPGDITRQVLLDAGFELDQQGFDTAMEEQRVRARAASATSEAVFAESEAMRLRDRGLAVTEFVGYEQLGSSATIGAILGSDGQLLDRAAVGTEVRIVVDRTPFYAQGGGQIGDRGVVRWPDGEATVTATASSDGYFLHSARIESGELQSGAAVELKVDEETRRATERNHTATHLLHAALRHQLGDHVSQAGSEVSAERLRFDYTHGDRLSDEQIQALEDEVNGIVLDAVVVEPVVRSLEEARAAGFIAMFGEKYGDQVRTLSVGEHSKELCGGTHVDNSGNIGVFRIVSDAAVSAGTRRIEAVTGRRSIDVARGEHEALSSIAKLLKVPPAESVERVDALVGETKRLRKELEKALAADIGKVFEDLRGAVAAGESASSVVFETTGLSMKDVAELLKRAEQELKPFAGVVLVKAQDEVLVGAAVSKALTAKVRAGDLVKELATLLGGGGGGRPEFAQGKGRDATKIGSAAERGRAMLAAL